MPTESSTDLLKRIKRIALHPALPEEKQFRIQLQEALAVQRKEAPRYRPKNSLNKPGGLLDFPSFAFPVVIVPDIHARASFLPKVLECHIKGESVLDLLSRGEIAVVCVGDAFHAESRAYERWVLAYRDWIGGVFAGEAMKQEMAESLSTVRIVMEIKKAFPEHFHFLKGNHENITNKTAGGDFAFCKFVQEGAMCRDFVQLYYGEDILHSISLWEMSLPICAVFEDFCISHAEPACFFKREQIVNCRTRGGEEVVAAFTWTANGEAEEGSVDQLFEQLRPTAKREGAIWFGGHRSIGRAKCLFRQGGRYAQLHNPDAMNFALVAPKRKFDPDKDIKSVF